MTDPIVAKITFARPRSGREILDMVQRVMHDKWHPAVAGIACRELDAEFGNFSVGQWSRNEYDNVVVTPSADGAIFNRHRRYDEIFVKPHVWYEGNVVRKDYPFDTTEDQLIAGVNNFAEELVLDDARVAIERVAFRYSPRIPIPH